MHIQTIPARLIFDTGTANNRRRIDINEIARFFGPRWCRAMIGFYIFTGEINLQFITVCCTSLPIS